MLTIVITAPTPMMMPSIVRVVRNIFRFKARAAIFRMARILMRPTALRAARREADSILPQHEGGY